MNNFEQSQTYKNLARAFAGECQAGARYQFLASKCEQAELYYLKAILKKLAKNEMTHAKLFYDYITNNSESTVRNIEICAGYPFKAGTLEETFMFAMEDEKSESENIYPSFAKVAEDEGFKEIAKTFTMVSEVEKTHADQLEQIWLKLKNNTLYKCNEETMWKCDECGHTEESKCAWQTCPLCHQAQGYTEVPLQD